MRCFSGHGVEGRGSGGMEGDGSGGWGGWRVFVCDETCNQK